MSSDDGIRVGYAPPVYLMLNKPRGLVTTTSDEKGRDTVAARLDRRVGIGRSFQGRVAPVERRGSGRVRRQESGQHSQAGTLILVWRGGNGRGFAAAGLAAPGRPVDRMVLSE